MTEEAGKGMQQTGLWCRPRRPSSAARPSISWRKPPWPKCPELVLSSCYIALLANPCICPLLVLLQPNTRLQCTYKSNLAYIRMYICTYICMYVCMYVCTYICMYIRMYVCMYVYKVMIWCCLLGTLMTTFEPLLSLMFWVKVLRNGEGRGARGGQGKCQGEGFERSEVRGTEGTWQKGYSNFSNLHTYVCKEVT